MAPPVCEFAPVFDPARAAQPELHLRGSGVAAEYAVALLESLGARVVRAAGPPDPSPARDWARSGAMALTGTAAGPPLPAPGPLASAARGALRALELLAGASWGGPLDAPALLGERAACFGFTRRGRVSAGGSCRLLRARDRWLAVSLARPDDFGCLAAWLGQGDASDAWAFVAARVAQRPAAELVDRARLLGLAAALAEEPRVPAAVWLRVAGRGPAAPRPAGARPLVVDLSSLWAGPLCGHLLQHAGARVIKVESTRRPDGARFGAPAFFDLLNAGKCSVALDFRDPAGRGRLAALLERADIVVDSARPRALAQLGIDVAAIVARRPGLTWVSITGYGRREPGAGWVAFGDDAGVAAGLAMATGGSGERPLFCGDAIADPLTGLHAGAAALASWRAGGGHLLDLALCDVASYARAFEAPHQAARVRRGRGDPRSWEVELDGCWEPVAAPRARAPAGRARHLGADTERVLAELALAC